MFFFFFLSILYQFIVHLYHIIMDISLGGSFMTGCSSQCRFLCLFSRRSWQVQSADRFVQPTIVVDPSKAQPCSGTRASVDPLMGQNKATKLDPLRCRCWVESLDFSFLDSPHFSLAKS